MAKNPLSLKWHEVDSAAAHRITTVTNSPGVVWPLTTADLPEPLQRMPGVTSYYVTAYSSSPNLLQGLPIVGEALVARADGDLTKNYQYAFAVGSERRVFFTGPFKGFGHHVNSGQSVPVNSLFNQTPFSAGGS
jgi:hypothetical protein